MKKNLYIVFTIAMLILLAACGSANNEGPAPPVSVPVPDIQSGSSIPSAPSSQESAPVDTSADKYGGVVKLIDVGDFGQPFGLVWQPAVARHFSTNFSEGLVNYTQSGEYEPHLAKSWVVDMDAQTITFTLRDDVYFTDGSHLTSHVVAWNNDAWHVDSRGNEDVAPGSLICPDDYTVIIPYLNWNNTLFQTFASHSYSMISMENVLKNGKDYAAQNPVGTGPFTLKDWDRGTTVTFERNPNYWQEGMPFLDGVEYFQITDAMIQSAALMSNDPGNRIDYFGISNAEQAWTLMNAGIDFDYSYSRGSGSFVLCPNSVDADNNPLYDVRVRNAISYAIDREAICDAKGFGIWKPARQLTAPGFGGNFATAQLYGPDHPLLELATYNPEKAKALLAEAGYPNGFTVPLRANAQFQDQIVAIQDMLGQIGIVCELEFPESGRITELQTTGWDGILAFNWGQVMNTTISYFIWYHPNQQAYVSAYRPPEYEMDIWLPARRSLEIDNDLMAALDEMALTHQAFIPVYHNITTYFIRNGLTDSGFKEYTSDTMWTPWRAYWAE